LYSTTKEIARGTQDIAHLYEKYTKTAEDKLFEHRIKGENDERREKNVEMGTVFLPERKGSYQHL
jgi:hypothetical protein